MKIGLKSYYCALQLDIAKSNCSKSENGKEEITLRRISQIAEIFNVPMIALLSGLKIQIIQISNGADASMINNQINNLVSPELLKVVKFVIVELQRINKI